MNKAFDILARRIQINKNAIVLDYKNSFGSWIVDVDGKKRLDCFSQYSSQPIGWNHPKLNERAWRINAVASHNPSNSDCYTKEYCDFAQAFEKITPDFAHTFFISGGTLGVENALKAAFDWKMRRLKMKDEASYCLDVIHFKQAFHGRSGYTLSLTNTHDKNKYDLFPKFHWTRVENPILGQDVERREAAVLEQMAKALMRNDKIVAAIIIEPIQAEGGDNHFRPEFFKRLRNLADAHQVMLILDEVQTGMGATGKTWCYEHFNIVPDMICFGKKAQVCGFCCTKRLDEIEENVFNVDSRLCSTWGGNLTDMVRSTIYMEIMEEDNLVENAKLLGNYFMNKMYPLGLENLRGRGLMIAFDLPSTEERDAFLERLSEKMLAIKCGTKSVRLRPHMTISRQEADLAIDYIKGAL